MTAKHDDGISPHPHDCQVASPPQNGEGLTPHARALTALRQGDIDLAEEVLASGEPTLARLVETLHTYQAELEIQNDELRNSQVAAEAALLRFRTLFDSLPIAALVIDRRGLILQANTVARDLLSLPDMHRRHRFLTRYVAEADRDRILAIMAGLRDGEEAMLSEVSLSGPYGETIIADLHLTRLANQGANDDGANDNSLVCALADRTEAVQQRRDLQAAHARIARSEALLIATGRLARVGGWEYDFFTNRIHWTVVTCELHEVGPDFEPNLTSALSFYHPEDRPLVEEALLAAVRDGAPYELTARLRTAKGRQIWIKTTGEPIRAGDDDGRVEPGALIGLHGSIQDITQRVLAERSQHASEARFRSVFDAAPLGVAVADRERRFLLVNSALERFLGYPARDLLGDKISALVHPEDRAIDASQYQDLVAGRITSFTRDKRFIRQDGTVVWGRVTIAMIDDEESQLHTIGLFADINEELAAEERELRARVVFENTSEGIIVTDADQRILAVNRAFQEITGYSEQAALGNTPRLLQSGRHDETFYRTMWTSLNETGHWRGEMWNRRKDGEIYPQLTTISAVHDQADRLTHYVGVFGDITQIKRSEEKLYRLAHHDVLTGLPNRVLLRARMEQALQRAERSGSKVGVLFLDLDLFKNVNDTLGHTVGDALLVQVAKSMAGKVREADTIARLGGDEFSVIMEELDDPSDPGLLAQRLLEGFVAPFDVNGHELYITASIGISLFPDDGRDMDTLVSNADLAMYQAKEGGRNCYRFFEPYMTATAMERLQLETALRGALARGELSLTYQPQVRLSDQCMHGAEVLLRWTHPELGRVSPARFIPIAEDLGLIAEIGGWVMLQACRQLGEWDARGFLVPRLAVNLSMAQLERSDLVDEVRAALASTGIEGERLELEVTESMLMRHTDRVIANLQALKEMGIAIAVDDFGTGYSSMGYLKQLPICRLKIDKSFIDGLPSDADDNAIARSIVALARGLGLEVIAEGVETQEQVEWLRQAGCYEAQGYHFGRPISADELVNHNLCRKPRPQPETTQGGEADDPVIGGHQDRQA